ncbi:hypothetical protein NAEGRDRAFT_77773 [Naegleria gruberi]|uniref:Glycosyltransferase family 18 catalytic domain-containing protein n=1 Tax=Naegleria gruberi TaxID=5762 RepID=D2UY96_NAEGR|nr:uncharacterized protein NAEGRDRAFT_77773 [Naegleria gruberi]EFC50433.1 hypothetical protein NAEGRDRAFT_77773 [Naegleria gruberi]|eukprot:XP_002683177.1 hypothetical protein NAEGRDRAFT_77773 [Naegleria gruberi strain NEG-M]
MEKNSFFLLEKTMTSIANMKHRLFNPCISIFSTKGSAYDEDIDEILEKFPSSIRINVIHREGHGDHNFKNSDMGKSEKHIANEFFDMIKTFHDRVKITDDIPIILMDDNFVFCEHAFIHLLSIFNRINSLESDGLDWAGFRFSHGIVGTMVQRRDLAGLIQYMQREAEGTGSIDALLDRFFQKINPFGKVQFHKRIFYTYRYQLLKSSESMNTANPQCFESLTHTYHAFQNEKCSNSLFFPCNSTISTSQTNRINSNQLNNLRMKEEFEHDTLLMPSIPPSADYSLSELRRVRSTLTEPSESCQSACKKIGADCDARFFTFINRCEEIRQFYPDCKCTTEFSTMNAPFFLKSEGKELCVLGTNPSRFKCESQTTAGIRVCPCFRHTTTK